MATIPMRPLKLVRHELFAQEVAKGSNYAKAYALIYGVVPKTAEKTGSRLARKGEVRARVEWLKRQAALNANVTLSSLIEMAKDIITHAQASGQLTAAAQGLKELGILAGHRIERRENKSVKDVRKLTDDELLEIIQADKDRRAHPQLNS